MTTTVRKKFPSVPFAHRAANHTGHCRLIHGHNWTFEVVFAAKHRDSAGFIADFGKMQPLKDELAKLDHSLVLAENDPILDNADFRSLSGFGGIIQLVILPGASCEAIAEYFLIRFRDIVLRETEGRAWVQSVTVYEDEKNSSTASFEQ